MKVKIKVRTLRHGHSRVIPPNTENIFILRMFLFDISLETYRDVIFYCSRDYLDI